eukprot:6630586-Alexandrium_andersonii.AAC.1
MQVNGICAYPQGPRQPEGQGAPSSRLGTNPWTRGATWMRQGVCKCKHCTMAHSVGACDNQAVGGYTRDAEEVAMSGCSRTT